MKIAFIGRAERFSPNSVGRDAAILAAVRRRLSAERDVACAPVVSEDDLATAGADMADAQCYVSMARSQDALNWLGECERQRVPVVNATAAVMLCNRRPAVMQLAADEMSVPPAEGSDGYWVKRACGCAQSEADVQYAATRDEAQRLSSTMEQRGIVDVLVQAHVAGDLVKCYGVRGTDFFRTYYPGDDGQTKFGYELQGGRPRHYTYDAAALHRTLNRVAGRCSLDVYGADCIIRPDGEPVLIDLNDWPSFSRCCDEAAEAIARRIMQRMNDEDGTDDI